MHGPGNPESFESCSRGAGRLMSRIPAREQFTVAGQVQASGVLERRKDAPVIDGNPMIHKSHGPGEAGAKRPGGSGAHAQAGGLREGIGGAALGACRGSTLRLHFAPMSTPERTTYHHGNLRAELIRCAREILRTEGLGELTLRAVARAAGVSHGAPRREFPDLNSLLAGIAADGFEELITAREAALAGLRSPARRLRAVLACYIDFAAANPGLFWIMHGPAITERELHEGLLDASKRSYAILERSVYGYLESLELAKACRPELVQCAWSAVHGMSMLFNGRPLGPTIPTVLPFDAWKAAIIDFALAGVAARGRELA